jgi:hypothetical protein
MISRAQTARGDRQQGILFDSIKPKIWSRILDWYDACGAQVEPGW